MSSEPLPQLPPAVAGGAACSRRDVLACIGAISGLTALFGCTSASVASPDDLAEAITVNGPSITIRLDRIDGLRTPDTAFVLAEQQVIVLRIGARDYRAFTNVCTHAGCGISTYRSPLMVCLCHGSEYDTDGRNVSGPAPLPLTRFPAELDAAGTTLRITKTA